MIMDENKNRYSINGNFSGYDTNAIDHNCKKNKQLHQKTVSIKKSTSLETLIVWNITKALEKNPNLDIQSAIYAAQGKLGHDSCDVSSIMSYYPEERYLACAILAWQQLGHEDVENLYQHTNTCVDYTDNMSYAISRLILSANSAPLKTDYKYNFYTAIRNWDNNVIKSLQKIKDEQIAAANDHRNFYEENKSKMNRNKNISNVKETPGTTPIQESYNERQFAKYNVSSRHESFSTGPVVKLPVQTKIVMRIENTPSIRQTGRKQKIPEKDIKDKIEAACCLETDCIEGLAAVDATTTELRTRAAKLARREAERVELLERAEAAWIDLELGYQRRLSLAEEKEEDLSKQIQKFVDERNGYKNACISLAQQLKERGEHAETDREVLSKLEKEAHDRTFTKLRLIEESARVDATLAEHLIRVSQLDRDLKLKEEQARHKLLSIESEVSSARALTHDTERAMRADLGALREHVARVSAQLLAQESDYEQIVQEMDALEKDKMEMVEDLDGCRLMCDNRMQSKIDELQKKRLQLNELKNKVIECRCKIPLDANVEVKRTPSLAVLCKCTPEEKILKSCSCTSLRSRLLTDLLADLFSGLQTELGETLSKMPCQLLKCLEDKHNWDRASIIKTNMQQFFSQLLISELDIAIATSIEKYHAKWVGSTCADRAKLTAEPGQIEDSGWQERVIEQKAQALASQLAEQLFQERADKVTQRAKDIIVSGPPPCACKPQAIFPCLVKSPRLPISAVKKESPSADGTTDDWKRSLKDIAKLKLDIQDMKKNTIKKGDVKLIQENIVRIMEHISGHDKYCIGTVPLNNSHAKTEIHHENKISNYLMTASKPIATKKKKNDSILPSIVNKNTHRSRLDTDMLAKCYNKKGQTFAVNLCLCGTHSHSEKVTQQPNTIVRGSQNDGTNMSWNQSHAKVMNPHFSSITPTKPIKKNNVFPKVAYLKKSEEPCQKDCVCFRKLPSNSSIDRLLNTLTNWKSAPKPSSEYKVKSTSSNEVNKHVQIVDNTTYNQHVPKKLNSDLSIAPKLGQNECNIGCHSQFSNNDTCMLLHTEGKETLSKRVQLQHMVPENNNSEYMAAINLDKSYNNSCECLKMKAGSVENVDKVFSPFKCIGTNDCSCKQSNRSLHSKPMHQQILISPEQQNKDYEQKIPNHESIKKMQMKENSYITHITQKVPNKEFYSSKSCDCDYLINFLGVTLVNTESMDILKKSKNNQSCNTKASTVVNYYNHSNNNGHVDTNCIPPYIEIKLNNVSPNEPPDIVCKYKDNIHKKCQESNGIERQELKYPTKLQDTIIKQKSCICCTFNEESKNLEENAFKLLEEYVKKRLSDFHNFSCKSSCILLKEEEILFSAVLQKVKKLISEHVQRITCECSESEKAKGNWNRVYGLLQEYLKIKINRVQCMCKKESAALSVNCVIDRIGSLIDSDFQRLKTMCKCNDERPNEKMTPELILSKEELPVKEISDHQQMQNINTNNLSVHSNANPCNINSLCVNIPVNSGNNHKVFDQRSKNTDSFLNNNFHKIDQNLETYDDNHPIENLLKTRSNDINEEKVLPQKSNKYIILQQNTASQVPPNLGMVTKSCDGLKTITKNVQTTSVNYKNADNLCKPQECSTACDCCSEYFNQEHVFLGFGQAELLVNHCTDLETIDNAYTQINYGVSKLLRYPVQEEVKTSSSGNQQNLQDNANDMTTTQCIDNNGVLPYLGCTINCSCDENNLSSCICLKSLVHENHSKINDIWKTATDKSRAKKLPYILMEKNIDVEFKNDRKCDSQRQNIYSKTINTLEINKENKDLLTLNSIPKGHRNVCDTKISVHGEEELILKHSIEYCKQVHNSSNTLNENINPETNYSNIDNPTDWYKHTEICDSSTNSPTKKYIVTHYPLKKDNRYSIKENDIGRSTVSLSTELYHDCHCNRVPLCHVKLLVEQMETDLGNFNCTCGSLISNVCPINSSNFL